MTNHDPLCPSSGLDVEATICVCSLLSKAREDERQEILIDIEQQLRINYSLGVPDSLTNSEFFRGQEAAYRHILGMLEEQQR